MGSMPFLLPILLSFQGKHTFSVWEVLVYYYIWVGMRYNQNMLTKKAAAYTMSNRITLNQDRDTENRSLQLYPATIKK